MSIALNLTDWLERPERQARLSALSAATTLPEMVMVALQVGLMVARWLLETELMRRAQRPQDLAPIVVAVCTQKGFSNDRCRPW